MNLDHAPPDGLRERLRKALVSQSRDADRVVQVAHYGLIVVGGFLAGAAQFIHDDLQPPFDWLSSAKAFIGVGGAVLVAVGASVTFWLQRRNPEVLALAIEAQSNAEAITTDALALRQKLTAEFELLKDFEDRRTQVASALFAILEAVDEIVVDTTPPDIRRAIELVLTAGADRILAGLKLRDDKYCFSVFQRKAGAEGEYMEVVGERRSRAFTRKDASPRKWQKGQGFTGFAWLRGHEIQYADTCEKDCRDMCGAENGVTEDDRVRYRSVISVPIRPGRDRGEPWGMITVTSDQPKRFGDPENGGHISADAVKMIAKALAIMVAARYSNPPTSRARLTGRSRGIAHGV